jgi:hypothetical protein
VEIQKSGPTRFSVFLYDRPMMLRAAVVVVVVAGFAVPAGAHIQLTSPTQRYSDQKLGPCGRGSSDARTDKVTVLPPGATITVRWTETINHPGHYRIAFDDDGTDGFINPASTTDFDNSSAVLEDNIPDTSSGGAVTFSVTLPDIECDNCTLQVIQVMYDKQGNGFGNDDFYFQCADLLLSATAADAGPGGSGGDDPGDDDVGSGCTATGRSSSIATALLVLMAAFVSARFRRQRR